MDIMHMWNSIAASHGQSCELHYEFKRLRKDNSQRTMHNLAINFQNDSKVVYARRG